MEAFIFVWIVIALLAAIVAVRKGRSGVLWLVYGLLLPPAALLLILLPNLRHRQARAEAAAKTCPRCAETVKAAAQICRHCGHEFAE
jgi:hypothetical protein